MDLSPSFVSLIAGRRLRSLAAHGLAVVLLASTACAPRIERISTATPGPPLSGTLTVGGSTALQPLVEQAAMSFQLANPSVRIVVSGGGSGAGRNGVCQGSLDVGLSDVPLTESDHASLACGDAVETAIAMDAFVVAANPSGPGKVAAMNREEMQAIFSGAVKNWSEVGGSNQPLVVVNRIKGSGTRQSMANYLFSGDDTLFRGDARELESNEEVANTLGATPGAISYLSAAYLSDPALITLGIERPEGLTLPTRAAIARLQWPIGGPGLAITKGQRNVLATAFISYLIGPGFQSDGVWSTLGYVPPSNPSIGNPIGQ
jgi:phosphate transport system substrate-binding protein